MANIHNKKFIDAIDKLNKMAYMLVSGNAKAWADQASQMGLISYKERARIEQLVDLRNSFGHGNSAYINVGSKEVKEVNNFVKIMNKTAKQVKASNVHRQPTFPPKRFVARGTAAPRGPAPTARKTSQDYYQKMYGWARKGDTPSGTHKPYQFVNAPAFGKQKDGYGWVICNHDGQFLSSTSYVSWSSDFHHAQVFQTEKEAKEQVGWFLRVSTSWGSSCKPFFRIRCIKMS
jgi:hypothetical protein